MGFGRMGFGRMNQTIGAAALAASFGAAALLGGAGEARAEGPVSGTGKGIVGGALLGGEVVTITMAIIGVEKGWPYFVFGAVGCVGGGIGGFFVEDAGPPAEVPLYMLAGGMALVIPAVVASLNATAYRPPEGLSDDPSNNEPATETPGPDGTTIRRINSGVPKRSRQARFEAPHIPMSIVDLHQGQLAFGVPAVEVRPLYTERERATFGVEQGREVRFPVFRASF